MQPYFFVPGYSYFPYQYFNQGLQMPSFQLPVSTHIEPLILQSQILPTNSLQASGIKVEIANRQVQEVPVVKRRQLKFKKSENRQRIADILELSNRNILPNMNNVLLSYIRRVNRSGKQVQKVLQNYVDGESQTKEKLKKFYAYQNYIKNNVSDFIIRQAIQAVMSHQNAASQSFTLQDQHLFNMVFRVVLFKYLDQEYLTIILSGPMEQSKRRDHLRVRNYLLKILRKGRQ